MKTVQEFLGEASYPLAAKWQSGKDIKANGIELVHGKSGVHSIKKAGKVIGSFSLDSDSDQWVTNIKGQKGQITSSEIDDLVKELK